MQINPRLVPCLLLGAGLVLGCASTPTATQTAGPSAEPTVGQTVIATPTATVSIAPASTLPTIGSGDQSLAAGTYRLQLAVAPTVQIPTLPAVQVTVPDGWSSAGGWILNQGFQTTVAVQFWNVVAVYRHPCQWSGTLFNPGPTVNELAEALVVRPLRNATRSRDVKLDGYAGQYLEWSVPAEVDFTNCDSDDGTSYFESWIGPPGSDRYQQAPGQVDRLWILDVKGARLVIDAFSLATATPSDVDQLVKIVESIRFEP